MHDPKEIFQTAEKFYQAVRLMGHEIYRHHIELVLPQCITSAFCAELYLKCIVTIESESGDTPKGIHDLRNLFDKVSDKSQKKIKDWHDKIDAADPTRNLRIKMHPDSPRTFDEKIASCRGVFKAWRYAYEDGGQIGASSWPGGAITASLREFVLDQHPDWLPPYAKRWGQGLQSTGHVLTKQSRKLSDDWEDPPSGNPQ